MPGSTRRFEIWPTLLVNTGSVRIDLVVDLHERGGMTDPQHGEARVLVDRLLQLLDLARRHEERAGGSAGRAREDAARQRLPPRASASDGSGERASAHQKYLMRKVPIAVSGPLSGAIVAWTPKIP